MKVCYTAIFGNYEELKEPAVISSGWEYVCFTDQNISSNIWQVNKVPLIGTASRTARYYKIMFHEVIKEKYSLWIDASFQINVDLNKWWQRFTPPMTCIKHPIRQSVYAEAKACLMYGRGNHEEINTQIARYSKLKIPGKSYLIQSGILMRERTKPVIDFCTAWHNELSISSTRDQLSFVYAAFKKPVHNTTNWNYRNSKEFIFSPHFKNRK